MQEPFTNLSGGRSIVTYYGQDTFEVTAPVNTAVTRRTAERSPFQALMTDLGQIFRFFFGIFGLVILRDSTGGS